MFRDRLGGSAWRTRKTLQIGLEEAEMMAGEYDCRYDKKIEFGAYLEQLVSLKY